VHWQQSVRVLYLQPASSFGGAERQGAQAMGLLPRFGIEVVPVVGPGREILAFLDDAGVHSFIFRKDLPHDLKGPRDLPEKFSLWRDYVGGYFRLKRELAREVIRRRCDLIFASRPFAWTVASAAGAEIGRPVVWRAGTRFEHWAQPAALRYLSNRWPPRAVIYTSAAVQQGLSPAVNAPGFVLHNGVDVARFSPARALPSLREELGLGEAPIVALVARIAPEKGTRLLIDLCAQLARRRPDARILIAGDSGWRPQLAKALAEAKLDGTVRLLGFVREVERVYAAADVVLSTSRDEGCPNGLLEAMAMGRAVVATRVGGTEEILRDGKEGLLAPANDLGAIATKVLSLLASQRRREELGAAAVARVRANFSVADRVRRLADILRWAAGECDPMLAAAAEDAA
jgi:glycosyltransferase involved in cell wall biosynthesis